ncbi:unnamed protein product [Nezara viridula]|uniref:IRS-type PTB domain-containing protein n=1 Tax=Nezara viridula TaxID=85310 RepID=A0A9P0GVW6_NEZVI|nr:unnamed protein product [Nezara viridula]
MAVELDVPYKQGYLWIPPNGQVKKVVTKTKIHYFAGSSECDMLDWISAFQSVAFQDSASRQTIEEDNELYCSSGGDAGVYKVILVPTEASKRCELSPGDYTLVVSTVALQLKQIRDNSILFTWPYRYIRRYGHKKGRFTFEAGRKCESGEGTFDLEHRSPQDIFRMMCSRMASMKQLLSSRDNLLGDSQFQHALGMHARSRSPLPPSPTSTTPIPLPPRKPPRMHPPIQKVEIIEHSSLPKIEIKDTDSKEDSWKSVEAPNNLKVLNHEKNSNNYDKLNHFGSISRINLDPSYTQVTFTADWNSPQVVEDHGGYGIIRKRNQTDHTISNDLEYAVVCKPHRV